MSDANKPNLIIFFGNGTAAVCGPQGQMPQYQVGWHGDTIAALQADGIDWRTIREIHGTPMSIPPSWYTERLARQALETLHE